MTRPTRRSTQLPTPPKSIDDSRSSDSTYDFLNNNSRSNVRDPEESSNERKSRVLRRHSSLHVSGEIRAFFAISPLPKGKDKRDFLLSAVDRVSSVWAGPPPDNPRENKRARDSTPTSCESNAGSETPLKKHWVTSGLYAGSRTSSDHSKILGKGRKSDPGPGAGKKFKFTLPLFHGKQLMEQRHDFKLPWNLYASTWDNCKPPNWSRVRRNIHVDVDPYDKKAERPECLCRVECDEACLNRVMFYECDNTNCALDDQRDCSNRTFQEAAIRYADHKARSCGYEVFNTGDRGFGLRALRDFAPNSFILEYRGEVISTEECEHRMVTMYAGRSNFYFLNIDADTVLDAGRKGSEARFANHCCNPNARIEKWIVKGEPRIGVFAGKRGIEAGEEITYDYNFSWFEGAKEQKCMCGAENCRGSIGKKRAAPPPPKPSTPKKLEKKADKKSDKKSNTSVSTVKRVEKGRIMKITKKKVRATSHNGKITATMVISRTKVEKTTKTSNPKKLSPIKSLQKNVSILGKRKRMETPSKSAKTVTNSVKQIKSKPEKRKIAKPRSKTSRTFKKSPSKSPSKSPVKRVIYDTVSTRPRKRNVR